MTARFIGRCVLAVLVFGVLAGAACTSSTSADAAADGASGDVPTASSITCDGVLQHQDMCGRLGDAGDVRDQVCAALEMARVKWRPDFFVTLYGCFINHACHDDDDDCLQAALLGAPESLFDRAALQQCYQGDTAACSSYPRGAVADCLARRTACLTDPGTGAFPNDVCVTVAALNDDGLASVPACLAQPCDQVRSCLVALGSFTY